MKKHLIVSALLLCSVIASAFELGKSDDVIYCNAKNQVYAKELSFYLNKVFGKNYTLKVVKEQQEVLRIQLELADRLSLPVIIHSRESTELILNVLRDCRHLSLRGVFHAYSGSAETWREIGRLGDWYAGIGGVLTYKKASIAETVKQIPLERILLETDSPYLTPVPFRGKRNESAYVPHIASRLAELKGIPLEEVASATTENAEKLFKI